MRCLMKRASSWPGWARGNRPHPCWVHRPELVCNLGAKKNTTMYKFAQGRVIFQLQKHFILLRSTLFEKGHKIKYIIRFFVLFVCLFLQLSVTNASQKSEFFGTEMSGFFKQSDVLSQPQSLVLETVRKSTGQGDGTKCTHQRVTAETTQHEIFLHPEASLSLSITAWAQPQVTANSAEQTVQWPCAFESLKSHTTPTSQLEGVQHLSYLYAFHNAQRYGKPHDRLLFRYLESTKNEIMLILPASIATTKESPSLQKWSRSGFRTRFRNSYHEVKAHCTEFINRQAPGGTPLWLGHKQTASKRQPWLSSSESTVTVCRSSGRSGYFRCVRQYSFTSGTEHPTLS